MSASPGCLHGNNQLGGCLGGAAAYDAGAAHLAQSRARRPSILAHAGLRGAFGLRSPQAMTSAMPGHGAAPSGLGADGATTASAATLSPSPDPGRGNQPASARKPGLWYRASRPVWNAGRSRALALSRPLE